MDRITPPTDEERLAMAEEARERGLTNHRLVTFYKPERLAQLKARGSEEPFILTDEMIRRAEECGYDRRVYDEMYGGEHERTGSGDQENTDEDSEE